MLKKLIHAIALTLAAATAFPATAALTKGADNKYHITSRDQLLEVMQTPSYWSSSFVLETDIDLQGIDWTPIGRGQSSYSFTGSFDGNGYTIRNLTIRWDTANEDSRSAFGFFGYVGNVTGAGNLASPVSSVIENINFVNPVITRTVAGVAINSARDIKLGIVAGAIGPGATVRNISIRGGRIDAGNENVNPVALGTLFVGGAVADISSTYAGSKDYFNDTAKSPKIQNVYVNVDIDLSNVTHTNLTNADKRTQFNVGGVLGRVRRAPKKSVPANAVYSGRINAPLSTVGPIYSVLRNAQNKDNDSFAGLARIYAGEDNSANGQYLDHTTFDGRRFFCGYSLYDHSLGTGGNPKGWRDITDVFPPADPVYSEAGKYTLRTLNPIPASGNFAGDNPLDMNRLQGVNDGEYKAAVDAEVIQALNSGYHSVPEADRAMEFQLNDDQVVIQRFSLRKVDLAMEIVPDGNIYTASIKYVGSGLPYDGSDGTWQWYQTSVMNYGSPEWTAIPGANTPSITADNEHYFMVRWTLNGDDPDFYYERVRGPFNIIYVYNKDSAKAFIDATSASNYPARYHDLIYNDAGGSSSLIFDPDAYPDGDDDNHGYSPYDAVRTMRKAYEKLSADGDWYNNIIVVMGYYKDRYYLHDQMGNPYGKAATITGDDGATVHGGLLEMWHLVNDNKVGFYDYSPKLQAPTRFVNVAWFNPDDETTRYTDDFSPVGITKNFQTHGVMLYACYHDLMVDQGVSFYNFSNIPTDMGLPGNITTMPYITIVGGELDRNSDQPVVYPENNAESGRNTITLYSGCYARIICSNRNTSNPINVNRVTGTNEGPMRVKAVISLNSGANADGGKSSYGYTVERGKTLRREYTHDIGVLAGGQTDGSTWCDSEIEIRNGRIGRVTCGNIAFGRDHEGIPDDSFFGSTVVTIYGGEFTDLYGGSLGRYGGSGESLTCDVYFYGYSSINLYGGTVNGNIYGAGAGGVAGIGTDATKFFQPLSGSTVTAHSLDRYIPYIENGSGLLRYGNYEVASANTIPTMTLHGGGTLDLANTESHVNIYGGTVNGNVYGGGFGYSDNLSATYALPQAGYLFGDSYINIGLSPDGTAPVINGNVYGGGAGSDGYTRHNTVKFATVGTQFGNTSLLLTGGKVTGNVYGGGMGVDGYTDVATLYGSTSMTIQGDFSVEGNIYGGTQISNIRRVGSDPLSGNTEILIEGGTVGDCIFGGSYGATIIGNKEVVTPDSVIIEGNTHLTINRGSFSTDSYKTLPNGTRGDHKNFNIYGGGYLNNTVRGDSYISASRSLLTDKQSIDEAFSDFYDAWHDYRFRRFSIYGGGFGERTEVKGTTHVNIEIEKQDILVEPGDDPDHEFYAGKQFFDVAGGGYMGNVGNTDVRISGNSLVRKVIGGGFYGSVTDRANTRVLSGVIHSVYGGGLMGYVHGSAHTTIGSRNGDGTSRESDLENAYNNSTLWITTNVYGGNDVQGLVGTQVATDPNHLCDEEHHIYNYDPSVLFQVNVTDPDKGAFLNIYGGTIMGNVYGAGNGRYRGYYVPGWGYYMDGPERYYRPSPARLAKHRTQTEAGQANHDYNKIYRIRPQVGRVNINIQGNDETDRVHILGDVFGGGNACTVGQWNPTLQVEDPRRYLVDKGGEMNMNIGSHVTVGKAVHLGSQGEIIGTTTKLEKGKEDVLQQIMQYDGVIVPTNLLDQLGNCAYHHWYWDDNQKKYCLGFPMPGEMHKTPNKSFKGQNPLDPDESYFLTGEHQFYGFIKFIEMAAKPQLTFYDDPFDANGHLRAPSDVVEENLVNFDASDIVMESFITGGQHGFMTYELQGASHAKYAYDVCIPYGVTILNKLVCGSEDTYIKYYGYKDANFTELGDDVIYLLKGGMNVQSDFGPLTDEHGNSLAPRVYTEGNKVYADIRPGQRRSDYAIRMTAVNNFEPQLDPSAVDPVTGRVDQYRRYGGLIYGGCYESGITHGDVVINVGADLLGKSALYKADDPTLFDELSSLEYNVGRVFGGGFGSESEVEGNVYVNLLRNMRCFNAFGGGMKGDVLGNTKVTYMGRENSYIYGAIYGGGLMGNVGLSDEHGNATNDADTPATEVRLISGNVDKVYGGACLGDVYGGTRVSVLDEVGTRFEHIDPSFFNDISWHRARLIAGYVFGGNDMAGRIYTSDPEIPTTRLVVFENAGPGIGEEGEKTSPGHNSTATESYNGFPLIGALYGGANGNYGNQSDDKAYYKDDGQSVVTFATGSMAATTDFNLATMKRRDGENYRVPHIAYSDIDIKGGTLVNVYGGGDRASVNYKVNIAVEYADTVARAGFETQAEANRVWSVLHIEDDAQFNEVLRPDTQGNFVYGKQIFRLFGGNNHADMAIQPRWNLVKGHIGSLYSGANVGRMTYYNPTADPADPDPYKRHKGLSITVDKPDIRIETVYGGCRMGNVVAIDSDTGNEVKFSDINDYGATVNIHDGIIDNVYGGNDVLGEVRNGACVNVTGAISGDIYGGGNGNYLYRYDTKGEFSRVTERYHSSMRYRYFILPFDPALTPVNPGDSVTDAQKIMAINNYRPNVERAFVNIAGSPSSPVFICGNVYCGGNSSTVSVDYATLSPEERSNYPADVRFNIGNYVTINGVFLGSNGSSLADGRVINATETLNYMDMTGMNDLTAARVTVDDADVVDNPLYPSLLSLYMRAVEVTNTPRDFHLGKELTEAYIGEFCVGGNRGSMMSSRTIQLTFPESLVIYKRIVGGCYNANVTYRGVKHTGGLTRALTDGDTKKIDLEIKSTFRPMHLVYPTEEPADPSKPIRLEDYIIEENGKKYYPEGLCTVYGGCYNSGQTNGEIWMSVHSDMMDYSNTRVITDAQGNEIGVEDGRVDKQAVMNSINEKAWRPFTIYGGGYGRETSVRGNITVRMRPSAASESYVKGVSPAHASCATLFGGSHEGKVVGNTRVEVRDGTVLTNVYGASESAEMYGSTSVIIGFPRFYFCRQSGDYHINRADNLSTLRADLNHDGSEVVPDHIKIANGDIVSEAVYDMLDPEFKTTAYFTVQDHEPHVAPVYHYDDKGNIIDTTYPVCWNDIEINIGDPYSRRIPNAPFYGQGNVYGGGYVPISSSLTMAGTYTLYPFDENNYVNADQIGYGGNASVMIWDNRNNADYDKVHFDEATGTYNTYENPNNEQIEVKDHITIGTGRYIKSRVRAGDNVMGHYFYNSETKQFEHLPSFVVDNDDNDTYYEIEADGGIYGGGRKVWVKGFRSVDLRYYGYADYTPQHPKLINTFQRAEVVRVQDCVLQLQGATDFATNKLDATLYSMNRIGELQMVSSLDSDEDLEPGVRDTEFHNNIRHDKRRSRNYIAFFHNVHYLGAVKSSVDFDSWYHDASGVRGSYTDRHDQDQTGRDDETYIKRKRDHIDAYYDEANPNAHEQYALYFRKRNVGTAANMIGINNGYSMRIEGCYTTQEAGQNDYEEHSYFGPINGVVEIKLLTLAVGEGGGYVFALNHHDPDPEKQDFLEVTGNFVFPGAAFLLSEDSNEYNYIIDDCFPLLRGYDYYKEQWAANHGIAQSINSMRKAAGDHFDVNDPDHGGQEIHYWYVNGQRFFYNLTLTAYTGVSSPERPNNFWIDNNDGLVMLSGLSGKSDIKVREVKWSLHNEEFEVDDCDLIDLAKEYHLYISVDQDTRPGDEDFEDTTGAYMVELPRNNYSVNEYGYVTNATEGRVDDNGDPLVGADVNPDVPVEGRTHFGNKSDNSENIPLVGIKLVDMVDNSTTEYYKKHLEKPHKVTIVLEAQEETQPGEKASPVFEYTINLTIRYLLGPRITGNLEIENCALPGEYIFANSNNVAVDIDYESSELMAVTDRVWQVVPLLNDGTYSVNPEMINDYKVPGTDREVQIPAYYYQNGWKLRYAVKVNGELFYTESDPNSEHPTLEVHNYHRMYAFDGVKQHDLRLTKGCRIYIEDQRDVDEFFRYLAKHQTPSDNVARNGTVIDPQYGEGLQFYLQSDVALPGTMPATGFDVDNPIIFKGMFNGNGHIVAVNEGTTLPFSNQGEFYNTGFYSENINPDTQIFRDLQGYVANCYYYNTHNVGTLCTNGTVYNCYQNTRTGHPGFFDPAHPEFDLLQVSSGAFHNGLVAYNLNSFHLKRRDVLLHATRDNAQSITVNNRDRLLRNDNEKVGYIEDMFNNGDYRYAYYSPFNQFEQALRTVERPNYANYRNTRATHHNTDHPRDTQRWSEAEQQYIPDYKFGDYLFFGQDLTADASPDELPRLFSPATRVYRASGFYGDKVDKGFYFNRKCYINSPLITAIDFMGYRDLYNYPVTINDWVIEEYQELMFAPALDLPRDDSDMPVDFDGPLVIGPDVTRNLLIYGSDELLPPTLLADYQYQDNIPAHYTDNSLALRGARPDEIRAHRVIGFPDDMTRTPEVYGGLMQLVDLEDFNCPIAFNVEKRLWYNRQPLDFADGTADKSAWEGIYLPFTAKRVYGASLANNPFRDHGDLSHFYGEDGTKLHEYWLRRFTGASDGKLFFERPRLGNARGGEDVMGTLRYYNDYFNRIYEEYEYQPSHDRYSEEHVFDSYRYLSAGVPYIITFPGVKYMEFDCSGKFYIKVYGESNSYSQTMSYIADPDYLVPVTDESNRVTYDSNGYSFRGTFTHRVADNATFALIDPTEGTHFKRVSGPGEVVEPFRVYMIQPDASPAPKKITSRADDAVPQEEEEPADELAAGLTIYTEGGEVVIESTLDDITEVPMYDTLGRELRRFTVWPGRNSYGDIVRGFYIVGTTKLYVD